MRGREKVGPAGVLIIPIISTSSLLPGLGNRNPGRTENCWFNQRKVEKGEKMSRNFGVNRGGQRAQLAPTQCQCRGWLPARGSGTDKKNEERSFSLDSFSFLFMTGVDIRFFIFCSSRRILKGDSAGKLGLGGFPFPFVQLTWASACLGSNPLSLVVQSWLAFLLPFFSFLSSWLTAWKDGGKEKVWKLMMTKFTWMRSFQ